MTHDPQKYPIGRIKFPESYTPEYRSERIKVISDLPDKLYKRVSSLSEEQLQITYRDGGWNITQVVHHLADSHMNSFIRFKLTLTEEKPTIKPYMEALWAQMPDGNLDVELSLKILEGLHKRWVVLMENMSTSEWEREMIHPDWPNPLTLHQNLSIYSWHCEHHLAHIEVALGTFKG